MKKRFFTSLVLFVLFLSGEIAFGQWEQCNNGLFGGPVWSVAVSGKNMVAIGYHSTLYLSKNDGINWVPLNDDKIKYKAYRIALDNDTIYASTPIGLYISTDLGKTWNSSGFSDTLVNCITKTDNYLYVGTFGGVFLSTDNGTKWIPRNSGINYCNALAISISGNNIFIGTDNGVYLSADSGKNYWF